MATDPISDPAAKRLRTLLHLWLCEQAHSADDYKLSSSLRAELESTSRAMLEKAENELRDFAALSNVTVASAVKEIELLANARAKESSHIVRSALEERGMRAVKVIEHTMVAIKIASEGSRLSGAAFFRNVARLCDLAFPKGTDVDALGHEEWGASTLANKWEEFSDRWADSAAAGIAGWGDRR